MSTALLLVVLPYAISVLDKLSSWLLDDRLMKRGFRYAMSLPAPGASKKLSEISQDQIIKHISYGLLQRSAVTTAFLYGFSAIIVVYEHRDYHYGLEWILGFVVLGGFLAVWVLRKDAAYFSAGGFLKLSRGDWAQVAFCFYDVALCTLSVILLLGSPSACGQ